MRVPAAKSETYRVNGRPHAVRCWGLVMFLTPQEYATIRANPEMSAQAPDATEDQIADHDRWFDEAVVEARAEWERFARLFHGEPKS
jgi:hypothetical protein